ncbi:MAG: hypothetical protein C3F11_01015 [Methylocystaceae bacterium]|nr:MAG: hypothetical protein C3F11_01015 [Methylocystaceae bacterium]
MKKPASTWRLAGKKATAAGHIRAARALFAPLPSAYNKANGQRCRMRIARARKPGGRLSKRMQTLMDRFAFLANQRSLQPLDWDRFCRFVKESRRELPMEAVRVLLIEHGFSGDRADNLAQLYENLWAYQRLR